MLSKDSDISELMKGRQQGGLNSKEKNAKEIEGVPFLVPKDADSSVKSELIRKYLNENGITNMSSNYQEKFREILSKINQAA